MVEPRVTRVTRALCFGLLYRLLALLGTSGDRRGAGRVRDNETTLVGLQAPST